MFMITGLLLLGALSLILAVYWYRKVIQLDCFISPLLERLGEPDTSGTKHYTDCDSHKWIMKNVVYGDYLKSTEGFRNFMMNRTVTGTLILGVVLGLIPVVIVYLLFQSYLLIGTSLILVIITAYILRGPGEIEISNQLFKWQREQARENITVGDLAFSKVSKNAIEKWIRKLIVIGIISISLAPWGESLLPAVAYIFALFLGIAYTNVFIPISIYSMPLALIFFFAIVPLVLSIGIISARLLYRKSKDTSKDFSL